MSEEGARRRCKAALLTSTRARVQPSWTSRSETTSEPLRIRGGGAATNDACRDVGDGGEEGQNEHRKGCEAHDGEHLEAGKGVNERQRWMLSSRDGRRRLRRALRPYNAALWVLQRSSSPSPRGQINAKQTEPAARRPPFLDAMPSLG